MEKFTPIAMKCTQEQFEAIKPKLKVCVILGIKNFKDYCYIVNNHNGENKIISNASELQKNNFGRIIYEEWNEEIFLKACGVEVETLEQQLEKAKAEVKRIKKEIEDSKIKEIKINISKFDIEHLRKIRNYFIENDKTTFEHGSYDVINRIIKQIERIN